MEKQTINRIVGGGVLLIFVSIIMLLSWQLGKVDSQVEGPHIFINQQGAKELKIEREGNKIQESRKQLTKEELYNKEFLVQIPETGKSFTFKKADSLSIPASSYKGAGPILAISDIEGDFTFLSQILLANNIIDKNYNWIFGQGHLVLLGDLFDRGPYVTEILWLLYKLEKEAQKSGGMVHIILGNHEIMAMTGDDRYLNKRYRSILKKTGGSYKDFFSTKTELGAWLRTKNTMEIIEKNLFVHGGVSTKIINASLQEDDVNALVRKALQSASNSKDETMDLVMSSDGPLWYRGYFEASFSQTEINRILKFYNVDKIIVGHTFVPTMATKYNEKLIPIDVKKKGDNYYALLIKDGKYYQVNQNGTRIQL